MSKLYSTLFYMGTLSGCHQLPERSFFIKGKQVPVCARCCGVFVGGAVALFTFSRVSMPIYVLILLCIPMFVDWSVQQFLKKESNNIRRFLTGLPCGYALNIMWLEFLVWLATIIYNMMK